MLEPEIGTPNLRGPSLLAKIGVGVLGFFLGGLPLAVVETVFERAGTPVGPSFKGAYLPACVFGAWLALRILKRSRT